MSEERKAVMELKDLSVHFKLNKKNTVHAVTDVNLTVLEGETVGLVGESGCGKTTLGRAIKSIYPPTSGHIYYEGRDIQTLRGADRARYAKDVQMIFQDPYSSLDPRMSVREIILEGMRAHHMGSNTAMNDRVDELLELVGLHREHAQRFPHEFSGGQRQRIGIARALAVDPKFIVCDEPTSALDVSVQAQVISLLNRLQSRLGLTYLFISHDLAMVKYVSDRVAVMYLGEIVEIAPSSRLYSHPQHPYTKTLLSAIQIPDPVVERTREKLVIKGEIQSPINLTHKGCSFAPRCPWATEACRSETPVLKEIAPGHYASCTAARDAKGGNTDE